MRKIILIILFGSTTIFAQEKDNLCFQKKTIDLGAIIEKDVPIINVNFIFSNNSQTPLVIYKVKATCGCTVPNWPKAPIKSGENGIVKVSFAPKGQKGSFTKTLFVESNSNKNIILLKLKGVVK